MLYDGEIKMRIVRIVVPRGIVLNTLSLLYDTLCSWCYLSLAHFSTFSDFVDLSRLLATISWRMMQIIIIWFSVAKHYFMQKSW